MLRTEIAHEQVLVSPEKMQHFQVAVDCLTKARGDADVVRCWHGSTVNNIEKIAQHGFGIFSYAENGRLYGNGVYLGASVAVSNDYAKPDAKGTRHMLLCKAALGKLETSIHTMTQPSSGRYDSGTDNIFAPRL
ncbi:hypothetical protein KFL_006760050 [Klebsormidium nitens]|uniref:Poly [ADP-ribose] polymerase n=1 Tax=Klebsormidium nitens TaxID=105231 RepID=A0A1Y1IQ14_KLENI|nr:hypothetical protein KFL_006760050 [Klebsormidium nitens]|eukprot:GAQ90707.1 hypothetical protein KFL_006760050 [Klebsormidium nitens]